VINGKTLGGIVAIVLALGSTMAVSLAILLLFGIVPELSELLPILVFYAATFLLIFSFFAIALLMSTLCEESGRSLVYTLIIFVTLGSFIPALVTSPLVMDQVIGPAPEQPKMIKGPTGDTANPAEQAAESDRIRKENMEAWERFGQQSQEYGEKQMRWSDTRDLISPTNNYAKITAFLTNPGVMSEMLYGTMGMTSGAVNSENQDIMVSVMSKKIVDLDVYGILAMLAGNIIALLVLPAVFFGLAYVSFMRMDIR
jgi:ABC-2 type transport system permease protein